LKQADEQGVSGRQLTPFLLSRMAEASKGATLNANIALLKNNARVAATIAKALSES
jgi:pseudouridine-5'-phosphate glycosidase